MTIEIAGYFDSDMRIVELNGEKLAPMRAAHKPGDSVTITFTDKRSFKRRTAGPKKVNPNDPGYQSNHLHGHLSQLAIHFSYTMGEMKEIMKDDVPEWPVEPRTIGKRVKIRPVSEANVSVEVESKAIEWCHMIAGEEGITLKEGRSETPGCDLSDIIGGRL
jgi:hypothetical protein